MGARACLDAFDGMRPCLHMSDPIIPPEDWKCPIQQLIGKQVVNISGHQPFLVAVTHLELV